MRKRQLATLSMFMLATTAAWANHPVLVEGNCLAPPAGSSSVAVAGTCGDYDGDGRIGEEEDRDGDRVFGTLRGALGPGGGTGANQNGAVTIVTSGVFAERVLIRGEGNVTLQAAPGVEAIIDAVLQGDPGSGARQGQSGIVVDKPANRYVVIRNITVRNWRIGILANGESRVAVENCRTEGNIDFGILVRNQAKVKIDQCHVRSTGYRQGATGDFPTTNQGLGIGIGFSGSSSGAIFRTEVSGNFRIGIGTSGSATITPQDVYLFDNGIDTGTFSE